MMTASPNRRYCSSTIRPQRKRAIKEYLKRDLEKEMWTAGYKYSWRKMEATATPRATRHKS